MASNVSTFPTLPKYLVTSLPLAAPVPLIKSDKDVSRWHRSQGYQLYGLFLQRLNEAVVGHELYESGPNSLAVDKLIGMLDTLDSWIDEIPPLPTPQRFGNLAFRDWGRRLEERAPTLLTTLLPEELGPSVPHLIPYLVTSFGSFGRIDYGSGHELSFALFLLCLCLLRFVEPTEEEERQLVLRVFFRYLCVVWRLQDVYQLEPAGSHGVWGLDDYHFLSYVWGSAQIREDVSLKPTSILYPPLPPTNLYNLSIMRIHALKRGPFHEHSPQLYSIAVGVQGWRKVNSGMLKMYEAEVLAKRVVVQHIPLGGLISWDVADADEAELNGGGPGSEQVEVSDNARRSKGPSNVREARQLPPQARANPGSFSMPPPTRRPA